MRTATSWLVQPAADCPWWILGLVFFLMLARRILRFERLAAILVTLIFSANYLATQSWQVTLPIGIVVTGVQVLIATRFGLLAAMVSQMTAEMLGCWAS